MSRPARMGRHRSLQPSHSSFDGLPAVSRRDVLRAALAFAAANIGSGLVGSKAVRAAVANRFVADPFQLGVASGYPRADGFTLWTRIVPLPLVPGGGLTPDEWVKVRCEVAEDQSFAKIVHRSEVRSVPELAHSVHVDVAGLQPGRSYFYRFLTDVASSPVGRTVTAPDATASPGQFKLAVASCQHFEQGFFTGYDNMLRDGAELVAFVGDYIYESSWGDDPVRRHFGPEPMDLEGYRARHAQYKTDAGLARAHQEIPWIAIWDDHEVDNDWAGDQAEHLDPRFLLRRAAAFQAYYEHMPLPAAMRPRVDGSMPIYGNLDWGQLARIHYLDDRQYRSPQPCPSVFKGGGSTDMDPATCADASKPERTMLGSAQETWLAESFRSSQARFNLIAQQTLVMPQQNGTKGENREWTDGWSGYPAARARLIEAMQTTALSNPLLLGGDIHASVVGDLHLDPYNADSPVVAAEVCGTSLASQGFPDDRFNEIIAANPQFKYARANRRGYALVHVEPSAIRVDLRAVETIKAPTSAAETLATFVVEAGRPGIHKA